MSSSPRVILLEFNEIADTLIQRFIRQGHLPNFKRFYDESEIFTTDAECEHPNLEPWIQWVTVHTGLPFSEHKVFRLDEGHLLPTKRLWDLVSEQGKRVVVGGSMNVNYRKPVNGCILPDPWSTKIDPY